MPLRNKTGDEHRVEAVRAGIDWYTGTRKRDERGAEELHNRWLQAIRAIAEKGYTLQRRSLLGYYGYASGNCFVGDRADGIMIQLTGIHANDHFAAITDPEVHVSRIDVQMSVKYTQMPVEIGNEAHEGATDCNRGLPHSRRRKLTVISGSDGGYTLYIGAASSNQRGRMYNKEVQSQTPEYERVWRYEVVYRNELATQLTDMCPTDTSSRAEWAKKVVSAWYKHRGVIIRGSCSGEGTILPLERTRPTDIEAKLGWLARQVRPTIRYLCEQGYCDILAEVLGLGDRLSSSPTELSSPRELPANKAPQEGVYTNGGEQNGHTIDHSASAENL